MDHKQVSETAKEVLEDGKTFVDTVCKLEHSISEEAQKHIEVYMDELVTKVKKNPLKSILIAGGIGFLLSALRKK